MSYLKRLAPAASRGPSTTGRGSPLPGPRLRGRHLLRGRSGRSRARTPRRSSAASAEDGPRTVAEIVAVTDAGRAPKNDPAIFALAMAAELGDEATRRPRSPRCRRCAARARTCSTSRVRRGLPRLGPRAAPRGRRAGTRRAADALAYQAVKYRQREGVTHRDLLRLAHPAGRVGAGNPTLEVSDEHRAPVRVDRPRRRRRRPAALVDGFAAPGRRRRRPRRRRWSASTACRARRSAAST